MKITNAHIYRNRRFVRGDLYVLDGHFQPLDAGGETLDASGCLVIPGLIDIHFHGCVGHDFSNGTEEDLEAICAYEGRNGVTGIVPASMTLPEETLKKAFSLAARLKDRLAGAMLLGIDMEGPFFSPQKKGAQNPDYLRLPDAEMFFRLQEAAQGLIKIACVAPELEGAIPFIKQVSRSTKVSIAHTMADYDTAHAAFEAGASHVTHLFNAMPAFTHREPGVVGAAFDAGVVAEMICDGIHIHPAMIRAAFSMLGPRHIALISDSISATGLSDGKYQLGGQDVYVKGRRATLADGTLAGSATNLFDCMKKAIEFGIAPEDAVMMATEVPAREIGCWDHMGSLDLGKIANFVVLNDHWEIQDVYVKGKSVR